MVKAKKAGGNKKHGEALHTMESPDLSAIARASFLDAPVQENDGCRLHSTGIEEDMSLPEDGALDGGMDGAQDGGMDGEEEEGGGLGKGTRDKGKKSTGKKVGDGGVMEEGRTGGRKRSMKRKNVRVSDVDSENQESRSSPRPAKQRQRAAVLSDENVGPKSSARKSRSRKSSSGGGSSGKSSGEGRNPRKQRRTMSKTTSESTDSDSSGLDQQTKRGHGSGEATELEVVLEAFLTFCHQYRESVESTAVRKAIDSFSSIVKEELTKKITIAKELRVLMRDNAKVNLLIRKKTERLLTAKNELIAAEREVETKRKEEAMLTQRLADIRKSRTFLSGMSELTRRYLDHRTAHPEEKEEYGASSLPALLLETKYVLGAENQLRQINDQLEARLKETGE